MMCAAVDRHSREGLQQIVRLTVVPQHRDRHQPPDAERGQVVHHGAQRAGTIADARDLIGLEAGLDRQLVHLGIDFQIAIEKQIADQADRQLRQRGQQRFETCERDHGRTGRLKLPASCRAIAYSPKQRPAVRPAAGSRR